MPDGHGGGGSSNLRRPEVYQARKLRRTMSLPEVMLWQRMRGQRTGFKVRRPHPIGPYIVDFYIREAALVVEVDGEAHDRGQRPERDQARDLFLAQHGYRVLRIAASDVMKNVDLVIEQVVALATAPLHRSPAASGPPPRAGEEL